MTEIITLLKPEIISTTYKLNLPDPSLQCFNLNLIRLPRESLMIFIGVGTFFSIGNDFSVAMTNTKNSKLSTATSLSKTSASSLSLSSKLSKRYKQQVYLSLDLSSVVGIGSTADFMLLSLEKALVDCLDPILKK